MEYTEEQQQRLDAAQARARAAKAETQELDAELAIEAEIAAAELEARDAEAIAKAKVDNRGTELRVIKTPAGCVILKRPHPAVYKRFRDRGEYTTDAIEDLVRKSLVHPDGAGLDAILKEAPAALDDMADAVAVLCGRRQKEASEK